MDRVLASAPSWAEIIAAAPKPPPPVDREAGEKTTSDLMAMLGKTRAQAERWALERVAAGVLVKVKRQEGSRGLNAWRPVPCDSAA